MDRVYAENRYLYILSSPENLPHSLVKLGTPGISVPDSRKLVSKDGETGAQCRKSRINTGAYGPDTLVSAATVPDRVFLSESETHVPGSIADRSINAFDQNKVSENTIFAETSEVKPVKYDFALSPVSSSVDNAGKSVPVRQPCCKKFLDFPNCRQSRPAFGGAISTAGGPGRAQTKAQGLRTTQ